MTYDVPDKPLSEFTEEERDAFIAELKANSTPEAWEATQQFFQMVKGVRDWMNSEDGKQTRETIAQVVEMLRVGLPLLAEEIEKDPETAGMSTREVLREGKLEELLERVAQRMGQDADASNTLAITTKPVNSLDFMLDKVNAEVWDMFAETKPNGQMRMMIDVAREEEQGKGIAVAYSIDFAELEKLENVRITRKLEPYDRRVYMAVGALLDSGQDVMTYQQIYKAMGYSKRAGSGARDKIEESLTKMAGARVYIDNLRETETYQSRVRFKYDGPLLMMERISAIVDGQLAEAVILVRRSSTGSLVLLDFARARKQFTTIKRRVLESPLNKTPENIRIEDYLIERISHARNGTKPKRILFATLYKRARINTTKQKQRAWPKIQKLLNHYVSCGFIKGYTKDKDGVTIEV